MVLFFSMLWLLACGSEPEPVTNPASLRSAPEQAASQTSTAAAARPAPTPQRPPAPAAAPEGDLTAPAQFTVRLDTTEGPILIECTRAWAPRGADRFYTLVQRGYYTDIAFFRVIEGFMAQVGIHGDPAMNGRWRNRRIPDDPVVESNRVGYVSYAMGGPNTRTTQFFINLVDNRRLDGMGFAPFGRVRDLRVVRQLHAGYGEGAPSGRGPAQGRIQREGNTYLRADFPELDYIRSASIVENE